MLWHVLLMVVLVPLLILMVIVLVVVALLAPIMQLSALQHCAFQRSHPILPLLTTFSFQDPHTLLVCRTLLALLLHLMVLVPTPGSPDFHLLRPPYRGTDSLALTCDLQAEWTAGTAP
jgi:hypothetical protein